MVSDAEHQRHHEGRHGLLARRLTRGVRRAGCGVRRDQAGQALVAGGGVLTLQPGDQVTIHVEGVGALTNPVTARED